MGRTKKNNDTSFLTNFTTLSFVVLIILFIIGAIYIVRLNIIKKLEMSPLDLTTIETQMWDGSVPLMKQAANHLELKYDRNSKKEDLEELLKNVTVEDLKGLTDIVLVNQQLTSIPPVVEQLKGLKTINLTGNQLLFVPKYLEGQDIEVIVDNNILSDKYNLENQYHLYLLDVMEDEYNTLTIDSIYDENYLKEIAKKSLWVMGSLPKGGHSFAPLNEEHQFAVDFSNNIDENGGAFSDYVDVETGYILKTGTISGEFYINTAEEDNENARFSFKVELTSENIEMIEISKWEDNQSIIDAVVKKFNVGNVENITSPMILSIKELEIIQPIDSWPEIINDMKNLETLNFSKYEGESLPDINSLTNVTKLNLSNLVNKDIIYDVQIPSNIEKIDISNNMLIDIPNNIIDNDNLLEINVSNNILTNINDDNEKRYIVDNNFLSNNFDNQQSFTLKTDIVDMGLDFKNEITASELKTIMIDNIITDDTSISGLSLNLLDTNGEIIEEFANLSEYEFIYLTINGAELSNTNATFFIPINYAKEDGRNVVNVDVDESLQKHIIEYDLIKSVLEESTPDIVEVNVRGKGTIEIPKEVLKEIKNKNKDLKIVTNLDENIRYTFTISGSEIDEIAMLDLSLEFIGFENIADKKDIILAFQYLGSDLPEGTTLTINMIDKFGSSEHYLYIITEKEKLKYVSSILKVDDHITFPVATNGKYYVSNGIVENGLDNPGDVKRFDFTPLSVTLVILAFAIGLTFVWGGRRMFLKKGFATNMPENKTYSREYTDYREKEKQVSSDTMDFTAITPEILKEFESPKRVHKTSEPESFSIYENELNFNTRADEVLKEKTRKFEGLEKHFGANSNFRGSEGKLPAEYVYEFNEWDELNIRKKSEKIAINTNNFDEFKLDF